MVQVAGPGWRCRTGWGEHRLQGSSLEERVRLGRLADEMSKVGYWHLDAQTQRIRWSDGMFSIFGQVPGWNQGSTRPWRWSIPMIVNLLLRSFHFLNTGP